MVWSEDYFDADDVYEEMEEIHETLFNVCSASFEEFIVRLWIENELYFGGDLGDISPTVLTEYAQ